MPAPAFLGPLALIFLAALGAAYALHRLRQPPLIGFLAAGAVLGPFGLGLVRDVAVVESLAELGVVLLLFTIGLELSLGNLRRFGRIVWVAGPLQVLGTVALVFAVVRSRGVAPAASVFAGYLVALSSTAIVLKLLSDRREMDAPHGKFLIGILIVQDLAVVPMLVSLELLARSGAGAGPMVMALLKAAAAAAALVVAARVLVPRFIGALAGTRQKEIFVVAVLFLVLGSALATSWAGLSAALGAFLAGLVLSESDYGHQALADVSAFRDAFSAIFFVSIGMLFQPRALAEQPVAVAVVLALILVGKTAVGGLPVLLLGYGTRVALVVGISLAQIGEFSFVLLRQGLAAGLISPGGYQIFLAAAIITMIATPFLSEASHALAERAAPRLRSGPREDHPPAARENHVLVFGYGHMGYTVARLLKRTGTPFRVLDLDPDRVRRGRKQGMPIEYGDSTNDHVLRRVGVEKARAAIVLLPDARTTRQTLKHCRRLAPTLILVARTRYSADIPALAGDGADEVVAEEFESSLAIAARTLERLGLRAPWLAAETEELRRAQRAGFLGFRRPGGEG